MFSNNKTKRINPDLSKAVSAVMQKPKARLNIWIDEDDYDQLRMIAIERKTNVTYILKALIKGFIELKK